MIVTFLGTGTSTGVPVVGCRCGVCTSDDPRNSRLRQSVKIETNGKFFLIDTTPDLRLQLLRDPIHAFANAPTAKAIRRAFSYIWNDTQIGGGKPQLELHEVDGTFRHHDIDVVPLPVIHGDWTILGYRIGPFAYITDTNGIPESTAELLRGVDTLALDGLRPSPPHPTHFTIGEAVEAAQRIGARMTYLIHLT